MRFSLCVICGNEAEHILTMLNSFAGVFDELSLVRAIGGKQADDTVDLAREWCRRHGKVFLFLEHQNEIGAEKWDHVDSFADARNAAFRQASGDWLIWCDCDDVFEGDADQFRQRLESASEELKLVRCYYDVRGSGKKLFRERAIRKSAFDRNRKWHHSVHENLLLIDGDKHEDWDQPIWIHAPVEVKKDNRRRNLRILAHSVRETPTQYFYIHQEHYCAQNRDAAMEFGKVALSFPNLQPAFRYETLLNCARLTSNTREANLLLLEAHGIFPWCREAVAGLILLAFQKKDYRKAVWWADQMMQLQEPQADERPWTHEPRFYGWAGYDLAARAHRVNGNAIKADEYQRLFHAGKTPKISLLHATRGRSSQAVSTRDTWLNAASNPSQVEHIFAVDLDDMASSEMAKQFTSVFSARKSCVLAWNMAARKATGEILVQLSDDWAPCVGWDEKLLVAIGDRDPLADSFVAQPSDGSRNDDLLCMAILSRARLEQQGDLFFEGYESVFSDNEFSKRAFADRIVIDARKTLLFTHHHPSFGKGKMDSTYAHNNASDRYKAGEALFKERNP